MTTTDQTADVYTREGADLAIQEVVSAQAAETAQALEALAGRVQALEAGAAPVEAAALPRIVVIGSSNASPAAGWAGDLAQRMGAGDRVHNFAIGGGGFTSSQESCFGTQVANAVFALSPVVRAEVTHVFVVDMLNDVRAQENVEVQAETVFRSIRSAFPAARIILVPVLFNGSHLNAYVQMAISCEARTNEAARAGLGHGVEVVWGSWTWFRCGPAEAAVTDEPGGVHFTQAGYARLVDYLTRYLRGADVDRNYGWDFPVHTNAYSVVPDRNYVRSKRVGDICYIGGSFQTRVEIGADWDLMELPGFMRPFENVHLAGFDSHRKMRSFYVASNGVLYANEGIPGGTQVFMNGSYPQF